MGFLENETKSIQIPRHGLVTIIASLSKYMLILYTFCPFIVMNEGREGPDQRMEKEDFYVCMYVPTRTKMSWLKTRLFLLLHYKNRK